MEVRPSLLAGMWYPADPERLKQEIQQHLAHVKAAALPGKIWGVVAPHAGYRYSGPVAAYAFKCVSHMHFDVVAVISPLHYPHRARLVTTAHTGYATPLGTIKVADELLDRLDAALQTSYGYTLARAHYDQEHAVEIELPFLQYVLGSFLLLPVMMADQSAAVAVALGRALASALENQKALLVASSDLSHFYPQSLAEQLDSEMLCRLAAFDPDGVLHAEEEGVGFACGRGAIAAVLWAAQQLGANRVTILRHATSGDVTGDYDAVVGYGAAAIWQDN